MASESEGGPVAEEIRRRILRMIAAGTLPPGSRLGSEREVSERFGVSRVTIRSAILPLTRAGVLERRTGRSGGTFVRSDVMGREAAEQLGLPERLAAGGHSASSTVLATRRAPATPLEAEALRVPVGEELAVIERLRSAEGIPLSLDRAHFPLALAPDLLDQPLSGSLYVLLRDRYGLRPEKVEEEIMVVGASRREAKLLEVAERFPLVQVVRVAEDASGRRFEYSEDLFRSDRVRLIARRSGGRTPVESRSADGLIELTVAP
ncbi:GntR family transcriptional regulator [Raineyella sp. LH-20]|uniref:GntR family transcriptional regulator n=1 Tax=Raineyella sp. LH-20 TaxID=3081204 RepID=UPI0029536D5E|nr:GntR family transcriptional regulator [Raineyella sp. LH-20]WOP17519.1 GntR family transcriptional regulator [Raineyella sp. LH-20]